MDPELFIVGGIVAAATGLILRQAWLAWSGKGAACAKGCGCSMGSSSKLHQAAQHPELIRSEQIKLRLRQ